MAKLKGSDELRCRRAARALLDECGLGELPVRPEEICEQKGIIYSHNETLPDGYWGALMHHDGSFLIMVSAECPTVEHRRFSAAHEIGHYSLEGHLQALLTSGPHHSAATYSSSDPLEQEANAFASELLMAEPLVEPLLQGSEMGLTSVRAIAEGCETSFTSAAIRYTQLSPDPVAIVLSHEGTVEFSYVAEALWEYPGVAWGNPKRGDDLVPGTAAYRLSQAPEKITNVEEDSDSAGLELWFPKCEPGAELFEESVGLGRYGRVLTVLSAPELPNFEDQ